LVGRGDGDGAAGAALARDHRHHRHAERQATLRRTRDGFALAALFRANAGIGACGVDKAHHRQREALCQIHEAHGFAIALRTRHAEIVLEALLRRASLFMADDETWTAEEFSRA